MDATSASWTGVHDYSVVIGGRPGICWRGGTVNGTYPDTDSWDRLHDTQAVNIEGAGFTLRDIRIHNYGDAIDIQDRSPEFVIRRAHLTYIRDDCVENDEYNAGVLEDSLLDGCYTALSARRWSNGAPTDGRSHEWIVRRSLIRLQPMPTVYKGDAPGHGRFFKWDVDGLGPKISLHDNVFRADQHPNDGDLSVPTEYLGSCSNNTIVWLGDGDYPGWVPPDCFTITRDRSVWDEAVADWKTRFGDG